MYYIARNFVFLLVLTASAASTFAQTTAFSYQGELRDAGVPANDTYDMEFNLFDAVTDGGQVGATVTRPGVNVATGVFTVELDFGFEFTGDDRWLEIAISPAGANTFTTLAPRQKILSAPHSIFANEARSVDCDTCITDLQIDSVSGSKVSGPVASAQDALTLDGLPPARFVQTDITGNVGIGAAPASGSKLTVGGQIEVTSGGLKFPDATTQTSAGLSAIATSAPLTGDGTADLPLTIQSTLSITNADNPARQPFYINTVNQTLSNLYTVPAGKTLVIEHISGGVDLDTSLGMRLITVGAFDNSSSVLLVPEGSIVHVNSTTSWLYSSNVKLYLTAGKQLALFFNIFPDPTIQQFRINGHLVDTP